LAARDRILISVTTSDDLSVESEPWKPTRLSFSMATTYQQCPRKWKYQYILGERVGSTMSTMIGSYAHKVLEYLYKEEASDRTLDTAREIATYFWPGQESDPDFVAHELTEDQIKEFKHTVWRNIDGLFRMENPQSVEVVATEQEFNVKIKGTPFRGFVDRIDALNEERTDIRIVDYKTGKPGDKRYWSKKLKQVRLYAAMVQEELKLTPKRISLLFPAHEVAIEEDANKRSGLALVLLEPLQHIV